MIKKFIKGKTSVFIDAANVFYSQRTLGWRIDFVKLAEYLKREVELDGMYYYTGKVGTLEKQISFLAKLQTHGYKIIAKEVKFVKVSGHKDLPKGNLDVELALDAFRFKNKFDTLVLFSGDSDFAYLLDLLKQEGKSIVVVSMRGHVSRELLVRAKYIPLPKLRIYIEKIKEPDKPALEV